MASQILRTTILLFFFVWIPNWCIGTSAHCQIQPQTQTQNQPGPDSSFANPAATKTETGPAVATPVRSRLRITWGGTMPQTWRGKIRVANGTLKNPSILGFMADSASAFSFSDQEVSIATRTESTFEGFDIDIVGNQNSKILIELNSPNEPAVSKEYQLEQILDSEQVFTLDQQDNRCSIARAPGDMLQFKTERANLIFEPGESFPFTLRANWIPPNGVPIEQCRLEVTPARSNAPAKNAEFVSLRPAGTRSSEFTTHQVSVPQAEGVYNLKLTLVQPNDSPGRFKRQATPLIFREVQFVVVDPNRQSLATQHEQQLLTEINPTNLRNINNQLDQFSRLVGIRTNRATGNFTTAPDGQNIELGQGGWQAIPLAVDQPGKPHVVEIEYPDGKPMSLGLSILQPDETGQVPNFGFDSGFEVPDSIVQTTTIGNTSSHKFVFWPNRKDFVLLVANRSEKNVGYFGKIRLSESFEQSSNKSSEDSKTSHGTRAKSFSRRKFMVHYEQPLFGENFCVSKHADPNLGQSVTDWVMFYESAMRLARYLKTIGADGAYVNVFGEGSSLLPLQTTRTSPRYDSGIFSTAGHDPIRKDVAELFFRIFEREDLSFVPVLTFDERLPELENNSATDIPGQHELVDLRQRPINPELADGLPVYDPLDRDVQSAVTAIVREVAQRYREHQSYSGIAVTCRPDTLTMLPGSRYGGFQANSIAQFSRTLPPTRLAAHTGGAGVKLVTEHYPEWLQWRKQRMSSWYRQLAEVVVGAHQGARLYLPMVDIFSNEEISQSLAPSLYRNSEFMTAMQKLGFDQELVRDDTIAFMQPSRLAPILPLSATRTEHQVRDNRLLEDWFAEASFPANLFTHRSSWARFENLERSSLYPHQSTPLFRLQHLTPAGIWNRERFATALLNQDSRMLTDGGLVISTALDENLRQFLKTYRELPDAPFEPVPYEITSDEIHPVVARYYQGNGTTTMYCVNGSPWEVSVNVRCDKATANSWQSLDKSQNPSLETDASGNLKIRLQPFGLAGFSVDSVDTKLHSLSYTMPTDAQRDLSKSFYQLRSQIVTAGNVAAVNLLRDSDFETGELNSGWTTDDQHRNFYELVQSNAFQGRRSLQIDNLENSSTWIRSNTFPPPTTGRLSVSVWLKIADANNQPPLRISVESTDTSSNYYRFAEVGSLVQDRKHNQIETQWKRFAVHFDDLPQELEGIRIGFDMMGKGTVSIDNVQLYDRWLDENDQKTMTQLFASVGPSLQQPIKLERCRQMLNSYWPTFLREHLGEDTQPETVNSGFINEQTQLPANRSTMRRRFRRFVSPKIFQFR